ncbi:FecR family protein [Aestuariibaculum sp. M13]|uniref:FecR family protein n=1 Tax=Aestuariibaculum sp. M13 TaxID=2967132 RepID=UPI002159E774|nr:FecR family protein [Aestuariibaculum sp. M13]MCR8668733.1 FecR family protein [Aestuariibaculum sp. M13]
MEQIVFKYLNDSNTEEERRLLLDWLEKPKNQEKFKEYVLINNDLNSISFHVNSIEAFQQVKRNIKVNSYVLPRRFKTVLKYAAVIIGVLMGSYIFFYNNNTNKIENTSNQIVLQLEDGSIKVVESEHSGAILDANGKKVSDQKNSQLIYTPKREEEEKLTYNTLKVPLGKTFGIVLSDGTKVTLNAGSELRYPINFIKKQENRTVYLNGEAFFDVTTNTQQPFIVNTQDMDVEVLGTKFNVTSYRHDNKTYAVLVEGKVAAHNKIINQGVIELLPNQRVFFKGSQLKTEQVNVDKYIDWKEGKLVFIDDPFKIIKNKIERKYGIKLNNTYSDLNDIMITATFENESIDQVLKTFQTYKTFNYTNKNGIVTITKPD